MSTHRFWTTGAVFALGLSALSGCSIDGGCSTGAGSAPGAVKGLVEASQEADSREDVCKYTTSNSDYDVAEIETLRNRFESDDLPSYAYEVVDQMGADSTVAISLEGAQVAEFDVTSDQGGSWTVYFGKNYPNSLK